ncbi:MAG: hypothetical protein ACYCXP_13030 [Leptospirillum sp.]
MSEELGEDEILRFCRFPEILAQNMALLGHQISSGPPQFLEVSWVYS